MKLSRIRLTAFLVIVVAMLTSCRDELCYNHFPSMSIALSWEHEWERDYGMKHAATWDESLHGFGYDELRPDKPEWVNLIRFDAVGNRHEYFIDTEGDKIMVDQGTGQSLLLYNGDTEYIILSDMAYPAKARASATSRSRASLAYMAQLYQNVRTTNPPDLLYSAYVSEIPSINIHEQREQTVKMQPLVYTYVIRYEFEYGYEHIALARGALGGMAESVYLLDGRTSDKTTIILYDCELKDNYCVAQVRAFGVPDFPDEYYGRTEQAPANVPYALNLEVRLNNGKFLEYNMDVTDQLAKQPRGGVITVKGLRVEDEDAYTEAGGFQVEVDGWGDRVDVDLPVQPGN